MTADPFILSLSKDWEQHRRSPDAPARTLLGMVDADPKAALALIERMAG